jgi:heme/copper-type cytochrome/quinol oxidase subunit 3
VSTTAVRYVRPNGWWGMAVFVATEATLFGTLFGTYFYLRFENAQWPPPDVEVPAALTPALLTLGLVLTSVPMQRAARAARALRRASAWRSLLVASAVQVTYLVWQLHDYAGDWRLMRPQESAYASVYLTLAGVDHAHVLVGVLLNAWLLVRIASRLTRYRVVGVQAATFYWHAVNTITALVLLVEVWPHL